MVSVTQFTLKVINTIVIKSPFISVKFSTFKETETCHPFLVGPVVLFALWRRQKNVSLFD